VIGCAASRWRGVFGSGYEARRRGKLAIAGIFCGVTVSVREVMMGTGLPLLLGDPQTRLD
jgi:hypothetical protein